MEFPLSQIVPLCLLSLHWVSLRKIWCCLLYSSPPPPSPNHIFIHIDKILPEPSPSSAIPALSTSLCMTDALSPSSLWPFAGFTLVCLCPYAGAHNWSQYSRCVSSVLRGSITSLDILLALLLLQRIRAFDLPMPQELIAAFC